MAASKGEAVFSIAKVDAATGEIAGVFESVQPSDTDLGAKAPKDVKITGLWCAGCSSLDCPQETALFLSIQHLCACVTCPVHMLHFLLADGAVIAAV